MANDPHQNQLPVSDTPSITSVAQPVPMHPPQNQPQQTRLSKLVHASNSIYLRDMMVVLFERENAKDFALVANLHSLASELSLRVQERAEYIGELSRLTGSVIAFESAHVLRQQQDANLARCRMLMSAMSEVQIKIMRKIAFVVKMRNQNQ